MPGTPATHWRAARLTKGPALCLIFAIRAYQLFLSPLKGASTCRFQPTCSAYAIEALTRYGAIKGSVLTVRRLLRCHPWHDGGYDPVP